MYSSWSLLLLLSLPLFFARVSSKLFSTLLHTLRRLIASSSSSSTHFQKQFPDKKVLVHVLSDYILVCRLMQHVVLDLNRFFLWLAPRRPVITAFCAFLALCRSLLSRVVVGDYSQLFRFRWDVRFVASKEKAIVVVKALFGSSSLAIIELAGRRGGGKCCSALSHSVMNGFPSHSLHFP